MDAVQSDSPRSRGQRNRHMRTSSGLGLDTLLVRSAQDGTTSSVRVKAPLVGGFYLSDLVVMMISATYHILCSCSTAELLDLLYFMFVYHMTDLLRDVWKRPPGLSLFHAYMLCMMRKVMKVMPFLPPRICLSPLSMAPFLRWRTGGAAASLIRAYGRREENGFRAYWIRGVPASSTASPPPHSRTVVLYVHGGGFALGSVALYAEPLLRVLSYTKGHHVECVALEYELAPKARFPSQLIEALRCYAHLLEHERIPASRIVLAGDSAGGNLVMSMLLCLHGQGYSRLGGRVWSSLPLPARAVLMSPWLDLRPSCARTVPLDIVWPANLSQFAQVYTQILPRPRRVAGPASRLVRWLLRPHSYLSIWLRTWLSQPLWLGARAVDAAEARNDAVSYDHMYDTNPQHYVLHHVNVSPALGEWHDLAMRVGLYVLWGEHELMAEDIAAWTRRLPRVDTYVATHGWGVHVWPFLNALLAPTAAEREWGLRQMAHAIVGVPMALSAPTSPPSSMPSDSDEPEHDEQAQRAWDAELQRLHVET